MRRLITSLWALTLFKAALSGQTPASPELSRLLRELEDTLRTSNLVKAADLATKLDDKVQGELQASFNSDITQRVAEVLTWSPRNLESMFVLQVPIVLRATDSPEIFGGKPEQLYAVERLMVLNGGQFYRRLGGKMVRLTITGMGHIGGRTLGGVPSVMPDSEVTYFYFFSEPLNAEALGPPEESIGMHPLWRGTAKIDAGEPWKPGAHERAQREDQNWLTLVRPELLAVSSRRQTIIDLLGRVDEKNPNRSVRALPDTLPEWSVVDRRADFWGLRHYSEPGSRPDVSNPRNDKAEEHKSDERAIGITVSLDAKKGDLAMHYLSGADRRPSLLGSVDSDGEFQTISIRRGMWQLKSNIRDRGDFPFHYAAYLLGFGAYR